MASFKQKKRAYAIGSPLVDVAPEPIIAERNPKTSDAAEALGALWVNKSSDSYFVLTNASGGTFTWTSASTSSSTVSSLTVTGGSGDVLVVNAGGDTDLGGTLDVAGTTTLSGDLIVSGDTTVNGDFDISGADAYSFTTTSNTDPAISFTTNGGTTETMILTVSQGTAADSLNLVSTAGGIEIETTNSTDVDSINLIAHSGGVEFNAVETSQWNVVGASKDIQLNATGGSINATATEATSDAIVLDASASGGGVDISCGGAAGADIDIDNTSGSVNITAGEAIADGVVITSTNGGMDLTAGGGAGLDTDITNTNGSMHLTAGEAVTDAITLNSLSGGVDIIAAGGGAAGDIDITTDNTLTLTSTGNVAQNIYLHSNGGATETIKIHADQGTSTSAIDVDADVGGMNITTGKSTVISDTGAAGVDTSISSTSGSVNITAGEAAADAMVLSSSSGGIDITASGGAGTGDIDITTDGTLTATSTEDTIGAVSLVANGGTSESVVLQSSQGTGVASVDIVSTSGGITLTSGLATDDSFNVASSGGIDMDAAGKVNITSTDNVADAIYLHGNGGTSSKLRIHEDQGTAEDSIKLESDAGGITFTSPAANGVHINNGTQNLGIFVGSGSPDTVVTAAQGSLYLRSDGSGTSDRLFVNTDGATAWTAITTAS